MRVTHKARTKRQRGSTLLEIMLSMAVVLVGMFFLFRVLSVASKGTQSSQRLTQGLSRAQLVLEAMRTAPPAVLDCLQRSPATSWATCEADCLQWMRNTPKVKGLASAESCVFFTLSTSGLGSDATKQQYAVVYDPGNFVAQSSWILNNSPQRSVYDAQVTIGWKDDGTASSNTCAGQHCITLRTAIYRDPIQ